MVVASRTPEGFPVECPYCGFHGFLEPSLPACDAACPRCGQLIWVEAARAVIERVTHTLNLRPDALTLDVLLGDLGLDSLELVEFIMELEEELEIQLSDDEAEKISTLGDLLLFLQRNRDSH